MDMKVETFLSALEGAIDAFHSSVLVANRVLDNPEANSHEKRMAILMSVRANRRTRQSATFRARLLSMYSMDFLRLIENSRNYWRRRAYLADQENRDLRERLEDLENAWAVGETIQPDGSLRPSLADTVKRAAELEAENRQMRQEREKITNTLWMISKESEPDPNGFDPISINGAERIYNMAQELLQPPQAAEGGIDE
jgi:hypothetical protein